MPMLPRSDSLQAGAAPTLASSNSGKRTREANEPNNGRQAKRAKDTQQSAIKVRETIAFCHTCARLIRTLVQIAKEEPEDDVLLVSDGSDDEEIRRMKVRGKHVFLSLEIFFLGRSLTFSFDDASTFRLSSRTPLGKRKVKKSKQSDSPHQSSLAMQQAK